jgi:hypothetical protein
MFVITSTPGTASGGFCILFMKIKLEWHSIIFCNLGSLVGLVVGKKITLWSQSYNYKASGVVGWSVFSKFFQDALDYR